MTEDQLIEHRHGMTEFHGRLTRVEVKQDAIHRELQEFKEAFHHHDKAEALDRKELLKHQRCLSEGLSDVKRTLAEVKGFKNGAKAAAVAIVMVFGGLITLGLKKFFGL